jgi:acetolactate decarboxylase
MHGRERGVGPGGLVMMALAAGCHPPVKGTAPATAGSTTAGSTTAGSTTAGSTTAGSTTAGSTAAGTTAASRAQAVPMLVNASIRAAYVAGVYDGFLSVGALRGRGDFGLGAADKNDGEIVALDGAYYRALADGTVVALADHELVPFASVTTFRPDRRIHIAGPLSRAAFEARITDWLPGANRMFALRVHGRFARVVAGSSAAQDKPYRPFAQVYPEYHLIPRDDLTGTLVGFRIPAGLRDIGRQGYHFHLLSDDKRAGGHVDDETILDVDVEAEELHGIEILLPDTPGFMAADLAGATVPPAR